MGDHLYYNNNEVITLYQDLWHRGKCVFKGDRDCLSRYHYIKEYCSRLCRPIKVLDLGANLGYFTFRLSEEFEGSFVMVECSDTVLGTLYPLCKLNEQKNITLLTKEMNLQDLEQLRSLEHFDVVLALSIIHYFEEPFQEVLRVLSKLGSVLFLEHPLPGENCSNHERIKREPLDLNDFKSTFCCKTASRYERSFLRDLYLIENEEPSPLYVELSSSSLSEFDPLVF